VTLLAQCKYPDKSLREHVHNLVSQLEVFREISKRHAERNQSKMKERFDDRAQDVQYQSGRFRLDIHTCIATGIVT
jgi:hypothetical protein